MSVWIEQEFAERLMSTYSQYRKVSVSPFKLNCRCPICGDSLKDEFKARFWTYEYQGTIMCHCFNCDISLGFKSLLKDKDPDMYRQMLLEITKERGYTSRPGPVIINTKPEPVKIIDILPGCERLDKMPKDHPIIKYIQSRKIPESEWYRLYFTMEWPKLCNTIKPGTYKSETKEPRLVIPIYNKQGKMESFQGRALTPNASQKYITIKSCENATKIYGTNLVDETKDYVYYMEGPLDSIFIKNAVAITGGSIDLSVAPYPDKRVWILDNEPRHPDVKKRVMKLIEQNEKIVIWDKSPWKSKDINDMIIKEGATPEQITEYFNNNVIHGLMAKHRAGLWFKV